MQGKVQIVHASWFWTVEIVLVVLLLSTPRRQILPPSLQSVTRHCAAKNLRNAREVRAWARHAAARNHQSTDIGRVIHVKPATDRFQCVPRLYCTSCFICCPFRVLSNTSSNCWRGRLHGDSVSLIVAFIILHCIYLSLCLSCWRINLFNGCEAQWQNVGHWPANFPCPELDLWLTGDHLYG